MGKTTNSKIEVNEELLNKDLNHAQNRGFAGNSGTRIRFTSGADPHSVILVKTDSFYDETDRGSVISSKSTINVVNLRK